MEKVYENALVHRLIKAGLRVQQQHPIKVFDEDGTLLGEYFADLLVEDCLVVELKAAKTICSEHVAQILGYLKSSRMEHGLLINFGSFRFEIKKYAVNQESSHRSGTAAGVITKALSAFFAFSVARLFG
jgi:GxxExxY protein